MVAGDALGLHNATLLRRQGPKLLSHLLQHFVGAYPRLLSPANTSAAALHMPHKASQSQSRRPVQLVVDNLDECRGCLSLGLLNRSPPQHQQVLEHLKQNINEN